MINNLLLMII